MRCRAFARLAALSVAIMALRPTRSDAQECLPLAGHWRLDAARSRLAAGLSFNPYYAVRAVDLRMFPTTDHQIQQVWRFDGPHLHETITYAFKVDGGPHPTAAHSLLSTVPFEVVPSWQNCTLVVDERSALFGVDVWTHNVYVLGAAGRRLTILQTGHSGIGRVERTLEFDRLGDAP